MNKRLQDAMNAQINAEFYSAYMYLSMASYFEEKNLPGFANWMRVQFQEEQTHALKMFDHVISRGGRVVLEAIEKPKTDWVSPVEAFEETLAHERVVTGLINKIADLADQENDRPVRNLMNWFIDEQVEEEATADKILNELKLIGDFGYGLLMLDRELGSRVFVDNTQNTATE